MIRSLVVLLVLLIAFQTSYSSSITVNFKGKFIDVGSTQPLTGYDVHVYARIGFYSGGTKAMELPVLVTTQTIPSSGIVTGTQTISSMLFFDPQFEGWLISIDLCTPPVYYGYDATSGADIYTARQVGTRNMYMNVNGNSYPMYDLLNDSLQRIYHANKEEIKHSFRDAILGAFGGWNEAFNGWPDACDISYTTTAGITTVWMGLSGIHFDWDNDPCRFHATGSFSIGFTLQIVQEGTKYFLQATYTGVNNNISFDGTSGFFTEPACKLTATYYNIASGLATAYSTLYSGYTTKIPLLDLNGKKLPTGVTLTEPLITEVMNALPITVSLGVHTDGNLKFAVGILPEYSGSTPSPITNPSYDYIGFGCPYYAFQNAFSNPAIWPNPPATNEIDRTRLLIDAMDGLKTQSIRFTIPWKDLTSTINLSAQVNPDDLTGQTRLCENYLVKVVLDIIL